MRRSIVDLKGYRLQNGGLQHNDLYSTIPASQALICLYMLYYYPNPSEIQDIFSVSRRPLGTEQLSADDCYQPKELLGAALL